MMDWYRLYNRERRRLKAEGHENPRRQAAINLGYIPPDGGPVMAVQAGSGKPWKMTPKIQELLSRHYRDEQEHQDTNTED